MQLDHLPTDLRIQLLGLPLIPNRNRRPRGRPKLSFRKQVEIAIAWGNAFNGHAVAARDRKRDRIIGKLQKRFRELCTAGAPQHKVAEVRAALNRIGRTGGIPIKPPEADKSAIDAAIAKLFDISDRTVRRIRDDPRLRPFMPHPVWLERDWESEARQHFEVRQVAKGLMTPERFAKNEPLRLLNGRLRVLSRVGMEWEVIQGAAPPGARCSFISSLPRWPTDHEARAQRAMREWAERVSAWKRCQAEEGVFLANGRPIRPNML